MTTFKYIVTEEDYSKGLSTNDIFRSKFDFSTRLRTKIKKENRVYVNGKPPTMWLVPEVGSIISVVLPEETNNFHPENIPIQIIFEDEHLLIINKPPGLVAHPARGTPCGTLANGISYYQNLTNQNFKIRFINRIDMDTSGIILIAKTAYAQDHITKQMKNRSIQKKYLTLVKGILLEKEGTINLPIDIEEPDSMKRAIKETGLPSITHYKVLKEYSEGYSLLSINLETGRTHQIRVHLSHIGHPIAGDSLYDDSLDITSAIITRQALHAEYYHFLHPLSKEPLSLFAPLPDDLTKVLNALTISSYPLQK